MSTKPIIIKKINKIYGTSHHNFSSSMGHLEDENLMLVF